VYCIEKRALPQQRECARAFQAMRTRRASYSSFGKRMSAKRRNKKQKPGEQQKKKKLAEKQK
jgi:hypothetical protein